MRYLFSSLFVAALGLLTMSAMAADPADNDAKKDDGGVRAEIRAKLLKEFDKNGDGKLSDDEREAAREKMRALMGNRHGERGDRDDARPRHDGPREGEDRHDGEDRHEGHHDRDGHDGHHDGPPRMPKPEEMFDKFDKNHDGKLDKEEFMALAEFVHEHMPPPPGHPGDGPGRGADGPPPRGHFEGHFEGRLEGRFVEGDMEGPRFRDGDGPGRRFRGPDGPPPRDGDEGREFRRHDGPPRDDDGPRGDGPPRRRFMDRDGHRGPPPGDRDDDDDRRPPRRDRSDDQKADKDTALSAT